MEGKEILNADEAREIAFKKQDEDYLENLENLKEIFNEEISIHSKLGDTYFVLTKRYNNVANSFEEDCYCFPGAREHLYIDKQTFKELKNEFKSRGFKMKKGALKIKVSWWK